MSLERNLAQSARQLNLEPDYNLQKNNDPKHTARIVKEWLRSNVKSVLDWPSQSPDLNTIEYLGRQIPQHNITSKNMLKTIITAEWSRISAHITNHLVKPMPRRLQAVIDAKGNHIPY